MCQRKKEKNPDSKACYPSQFKQMPTEEYHLEYSQHRKRERTKSHLVISLEKTRCKNKIVQQECLS